LTAPGTDDFGFDDDGRPVPAVSFSDPFADEPGASPARAEIEMATSRATAAAIVGFIVPPRRDPLTAGRRALALAFILGALPGVATQKELARIMRCSEPVTSDLISRARFSLWKHRNAHRAA
jgi:hypothetical protein